MDAPRGRYQNVRRRSLTAITRWMLRAILNKSRRQHPTKKQLYGHLPSVTKTIKVRRTGHAGQCWRSRDEIIMMHSYGPLHRDEQRQDVQLEPTYSSSVTILDVSWKTCRGQWTIGRGSQRESEIVMLIGWHDDDDDDDILCTPLKFYVKHWWRKRQSEGHLNTFVSLGVPTKKGEWKLRALLFYLTIRHRYQVVVDINYQTRVVIPLDW